ncbi:hypothetical protein ACFQNF_17350 [Iodobacter arcticus]|uniref:Uncharacterized protein n=1 Tax=Iodobacter arcticus TaxID=590593 RepID=A0ABW2R1G8_9NEIS
MNTLRIAMVASLMLMITSVEASSYSSSRHVRKPGASHAKATHAAPAQGKGSSANPMVVARPQPHVQTLPATMLSRPAVSGGQGMLQSESKLSPAQETELRWRLYSFP